MYRQFLFILLPILFTCSGNRDKGAILAKVGDEELYQNDLMFLFVNQNYNYNDSITITKNYIDKWVKEQILVQEAQKSKDIDMDVVERRVLNYRNDLLIYEYENNYIKQRLDTLVSEKEIKDYYLKNQKEFQLNDYLVKVLYLKIPFDAPDIDKINQWYKLNKQDDINNIKEFAKVYAANFYYDDQNWIYFDDLLKEIPLQDINKDKFILKRSKTRFDEGGYYYFLNVIDYKLKNTTSPLSFERDNIKDRIINTRVKKLREEIKNELISKAYSDNKVQIYE